MNMYEINMNIQFYWRTPRMPRLFRAGMNRRKSIVCAVAHSSPAKQPGACRLMSRQYVPQHVLFTAGICSTGLFYHARLFQEFLFLSVRAFFRRQHFALANKLLLKVGLGLSFIKLTLFHKKNYYVIFI